MFITCNECGNIPQTVSIRHTFTHKKPRYQKLHGAIGGGRALRPLDPPLGDCVLISMQSVF